MCGALADFVQSVKRWGGAPCIEELLPFCLWLCGDGARAVKNALFDCCASCGVFVRLVCCSRVVACSCGFVARASCFRRVAFPLVMRSRLKFSLVLRFCVSVGVIGGVCGFRDVLGGFWAFERVHRLLSLSRLRFCCPCRCDLTAPEIVPRLWSSPLVLSFRPSWLSVTRSRSARFFARSLNVNFCVRPPLCARVGVWVVLLPRLKLWYKNTYPNEVWNIIWRSKTMI